MHQGGRGGSDGVGGARAEAAGGFRSVYDVGWPALRKGRSLQPDTPDAPPVQACFALIARRQGVAGGAEHGGVLGSLEGDAEV